MLGKKNGCCKETIDDLKPWSQKPEVKQRLSVVAISLDESETEVKAWDQKVNTLPDWKHLRSKEGINSKVANDYYILATPVMLVLDANTKKIVAMPATFQQLMQFIQ